MADHAHALSPTPQMNAKLIPLPRVSLDSYLREVKRIPMLSAEQETSFARKFRDQGDIESARQLVLAYLRVVPAIARGYMGYGLPQEDLIQEGNIGLMKAVRRFDPERGVRLVSFAAHWIKAEIHEFILRNCRLVRIATTKAQRKLFFKLRSMKGSLEPLRPAEIARIAQVLGVKPKEVAEMEMRLAGRDLSLDPGEDDEERGGPLAYLSDSSTEPSLALEAAQHKRLATQGLSTALDALDPRSRRIIEARWLREKERSTLHQLADEFKVSAERIRQIEVRALGKMKGVLADEHGPL